MDVITTAKLQQVKSVDDHFVFREQIVHCFDKFYTV